MNFVVATFLLSVNFREEACFWGMIQLFNRMQLMKLYDFDSGTFRKLTYMTEMLFFEQLPSLAKHLLVDLQISLEVYTARWFFAMFCIDLPIEYA